jgi:hypothetical protein
VPADILERVLALDYTPSLGSAVAPTGTATEVQRDGQTFTVTVSQNTEDINVEELRADPYEQAE